VAESAAEEVEYYREEAKPELQWRGAEWGEEATDLEEAKEYLGHLLLIERQLLTAHK